MSSHSLGCFSFCVFIHWIMKFFALAHVQSNEEKKVKMWIQCYNFDPNNQSPVYCTSSLRFFFRLLLFFSWCTCIMSCFKSGPRMSTKENESFYVNFHWRVKVFFSRNVHYWSKRMSTNYVITVSSIKLQNALKESIHNSTLKNLFKSMKCLRII